ncbi:ABC transporter substrate-binding protein [Candidatus Woesearchaeota archaeon]|jgi:branched-chain amino acid transport system substrate-binding protein|nr:ABC transporter substrate-binding protein [Candidatus Woesearchaeota archaeon]MBT3538303.1 ABC transporter substrate-binding protein [Candidatus Woesearchaeota archaeon]MBT4696703.1 ABC transporter substrate-binding protein [Candidatus Woesearchaeota archaeon]MBT4716821.1 ABC transporter substrate-binding protein [Candidatus Woesearchaeota archaeon]MBT7105972.1 ABC transporter substrate-binding protein [Candidatus Woesearchaeota archaeon]
MNKLIIVLAIAVLLVGCGNDVITGKVVDRMDVVEIGFVAPFTDFFASAGIEMQKGALMALDEINAEGGISGVQLNVIFEDGQCLPKAGVTAVSKLVEVDRVPVVIGPVCATSIMPAIPVAQKNGVPLIGTLDVTDDIADAGEFIFATGYSVEGSASLMANFAYKNLSARKVAVFYDIDEWGQTLAETFSRDFEALGGEVLVVVTHNYESSDFRTEILKMMSYEPDAIYAVPLALDGEIVKQAREMGYDVQFLGASTFAVKETLDNAGDAMEGTYFSYELAYRDDNFELNEFVDKYVERFGEEPPNVLYAVLGYDNVHLVADVMRKNGVSSEAIVRGLYSVDNYPAISGSMKFDQNGIAVRVPVINSVRNGEFEQIEFEI